jgi:hypothetical protein
MRQILSTIAALALAMLALPAAAQEVPQGAVDSLARDVSRVESVRAVKDLQRSYAQYAQFGLWQEMADLFADDAELVWDDEPPLHGKPAISAWLRARVGQRGLTDGAVHSELIDDPLVNLSVDGRSAKGRWMAMALIADGKGSSLIDGGIYENEYVLESGKWKFSKVHFYMQFEGDARIGWANPDNRQQPQVPFHFTVDETGIPIPDPVGAAPASGATLSGLESRIDALLAEDLVRNLQNAYGYYVDRKMWDDVVDLFSTDGVVEIAGTGTFTGPEGIRRAMETMGAQGLQTGQLNDYPSFDTIVTVMPGGEEAYARGFALGMIERDGKGAWEFQVFRNRFVLEGRLWKLRELRLYPLLKVDYETMWAQGGDWHLPHGTLPAFAEPHPVTGEPIAIEGFTLAAATPLTASVSAAPTAHNGSEADRLYEARRRLRRAAAYDAVVNISSAYGYYLDDFQWVALSSIFAQNGNKHSPFAGYYLGQDRIKAAATAMWGEPPALRDGIAYHWRPQPVIHVSHDGRSANLRTRLFQPATGMRKYDEEGNPLPSSGFASGMYPNDQAVLENGIWRFWSLTIDEHYMQSKNWAEGWAAVEPTPRVAGGGQSRLVDLLAPDISLRELGRREEHFGGGTGLTYVWPDILNMWFHYKNPVSGRVPEFYWPDSVPGLGLPQSRLISNGYQMPPNGPEIDGIHVELTPPETVIMTDEE